MQTDFSDLLTLATAADAFARPPLQREAEMPTLQREAPYGAPLEPSVVLTPLRTGAIAPGSSLNTRAPPPAQSEAYRSPHGETAAAPHHTLLENAARVIESLTGALRTTTLAPQAQRPPVRIPVPTYRGYADKASAMDFLDDLRKYQRAMGMSDREILERIPPIALVDKAARWFRLVGDQPGTLDQFREAFRREFLPADYERRMRRELEQRTQHPDESLLEFVRAMQELFELAEPSAPNAERVERVIRQSHPTFAAYLRGSRFRDLNELASEARRLQGDILAARAYRPPPPASAALEPRCAWSGTRHLEHQGATIPQTMRKIGAETRTQSQIVRSTRTPTVDEQAGRRRSSEPPTRAPTRQRGRSKRGSLKVSEPMHATTEPAKTKTHGGTPSEATTEDVFGAIAPVISLASARSGRTRNRTVRETSKATGKRPLDGRTGG